MDPIIGCYASYRDGDITFCKDIAYQTDMSVTVDYGAAYFEKYVTMEGTPIAVNLNLARTSLTSKYCDCVLDVGIGSGEFIKSSLIKTYGYDINPHGEKWLKDRNIWMNPWEGISSVVEGVSLWDTLEHMKEPTTFLNLIPKGCYVFISMPMFDNLERDLRSNKHYRPNEHYYYFTKYGFINYLRDINFDLIELNQDETLAGREGIWSFVFKRI